jgi:hypothetical protein
VAEKERILTYNQAYAKTAILFVLVITLLVIPVAGAGQILSGNLQKVTITPTAIPDFASCPDSYTCLLPAEADQTWGTGKYTQSDTGACGAYAITPEMKVFRYCYLPTSQSVSDAPAAGTTTPVPAQNPPGQIVPAKKAAIPVQNLVPQEQQVPVKSAIYRIVRSKSTGPGIPVSSQPGRFTATYSVGFAGLNFNTDGRNMLDLDLEQARYAGAEVTSYPDRIEIYQHSPSVVLITFRGNSFVTAGDMISGKVTDAYFVTSPLDGAIPEGEVTGAVRVDLLGLDGRGELTNTIESNVTPDIESIYRSLCAQDNATYYGTAFVMDISKSNLNRTGAANLTFTVPPSWVYTHGGTESVRIIRISEKDHAIQILGTDYRGTNADGFMVFTSYSPGGTSIFGLITSSALTERGMNPPEGQVMLDLRMLYRIGEAAVELPYLTLIGTIFVLGGIYLGRKRQNL